MKWMKKPTKSTIMLLGDEAEKALLILVKMAVFIQTKTIL
jgi:hypothetical protein